MVNLTFRNSKIIYYGPHECVNCGAMICKMGHEFGGNAFSYPDGPIYPNTEWHPHVCDPKMVTDRRTMMNEPRAQIERWRAKHEQIGARLSDEQVWAEINACPVA